MAEVRAIELAFRLTVVAVSVVGPTLLYVGLWRFLMWLRDDELVARLADRGVIEAPEPSAADVLATTSQGTRCDNCGTLNVRGAPVCRSCLRDLE